MVTCELRDVMLKMFVIISYPIPIDFSFITYNI